MIAALPFGHPLAMLEEGLTRDSLKDEPFLIYTSKPHPSLADHVLHQMNHQVAASPSRPHPRARSPQQAWHTVR